MSPWLQLVDTDWRQVVYQSGLEIQSPLAFGFLRILQFVSVDYKLFQIVFLTLSAVSSIGLYSLLKYKPGVLVLVLVNYYLIYEYSVIQRIYTLSVSLLTITLICLNRDFKNRERISSLAVSSLILFSLTSIWSLFLSFVIVTSIFLIKRHFITKSSLTFFFFSTLCHCLFLASAKDRDWGVSANSSSSVINVDNLISIITAPVRAIFVLPEPTLNFWNSNLLSRHPVFSVVLSILCIISFIAVNRRVISDYKILFSFWTISLAVLTVLVGLGKQRHLGQIVLLFFTFYILKSLFIPNSSLGSSKRLILKFAAYTVVSCNLYAGILSLSTDIKYPFSTSSQIAKLVGQNDLIMVHDRGSNTFLPFLLEYRYPVYNFFGNKYASKVLLNHESRSIPQGKAVANKIRSICFKIEPERILFFTDESTRRNFKLRWEYQQLTRTGSAIVKNEGNREIWILASSRESVVDFCGEQLDGFIEGIRTQAVSYGQSVE